VTPNSVKPDLPHRPGRSNRRADFAARLKARVRFLRTELERRDTLLEAIRSANAALDHKRVAGWLVHQARSWIAAPCWAVIAYDVSGDLDIIAEEGLTPDLTPSVWMAGNWVIQQGVEFLAADLTLDNRGSGQGVFGSVIALPLVCRHRTVGVLVGIDSTPSAAPPVLTPALSAAFLSVLEVPAIALDSSLALQKAEELSVTDDLTRLYNSRYLNQVLRREAKRATRSGRPLSLLFIDLDGFKQVNDRYGHLSGSKALVEASAIVRGSARETDVSARFGGDEFAVVLPDTGSEGAVSVAERVRDRIGACKFLASDGLSVHLTASIGVATLPDVAASAEELLRAADVAMYRVKDTGKNGIYIAQEASAF